MDGVIGAEVVLDEVLEGDFGFVTGGKGGFEEEFEVGNEVGKEVEFEQFEVAKEVEVCLRI